MTRKEAKEYLDNYRKMYAELATETFLEALDVVLDESSENIGHSEELEKFTEKMDAWKARYGYPDNISIKATMAFTARMFYQYPNTARKWYEQLPKATMD